MASQALAKCCSRSRKTRCMRCPRKWCVLRALLDSCGGLDATYRDQGASNQVVVLMHGSQHRRLSPGLVGFPLELQAQVFPAGPQPQHTTTTAITNTIIPPQTQSQQTHNHRHTTTTTQPQTHNHKHTTTNT